MRLPTHNFSRKTSLVKTAIIFCFEFSLSVALMKRRKQIDILASMQRVRGLPSEWDVPPIVSVADLAGWLGVSEKKLYWLADVNEGSNPSNHYVCNWIRKRTGVRLIESPKSELKRVQRQILNELLVAFPESHSSHGFVRGRNVRTFVADHCQREVCIKMDLRNFFTTIRSGWIYRIFERAGYPTEVSRCLAGLCTTATRKKDLAILRHLSCRGMDLNFLYAQRHLPQGAPTSPKLANLSAFNLDCRLAGLANRLNGKYSRYADDLLFSFGQQVYSVRQSRNWARRLTHKISQIVLDEGFEVNFRKTRIMFQGRRQSAAGVVLNQSPNICRRKYDLLKAILHKCCVHGPESQNRECIGDFRAHLTGRIAWIRQLNPPRAEKLDRLFAKIKWPVQ